VKVRPSLIIVVGDSALGSRFLSNYKRKISGYSWNRIDIKDSSTEDMKIECQESSLFGLKKVTLIRGFKNNKQFRDLISDISDLTSDFSRVIFWDDSEVVKINSKLKANNTWESFFNKMKEKEDFLLVNNGSDFSYKEKKEAIKYVLESFCKLGKKIDQDAASIFIEIVGLKRSLILSEVEKLSISSPAQIDREFILNNSFPSSSVSLTYNLSNSLDKSYSSSISYLEELISHGNDMFYISQIILSKAKWYMVIADLYSSGLDWNNVRLKILEMGKFPSSIWNNDQIKAEEKKALSIKLNNPENLEQFMTRVMGFRYLSLDIDYKAKVGTSIKKGDCIPMPFLADMMIKNVRDNLLRKYFEKYGKEDFKDVLLEDSVRRYIFCCKKSRDIRFAESNRRNLLYQMVSSWFSIGF
jgi:DNA polymerase III delta subunit